jgi:phospholipid/cholesterol/gamma-HCH transport system substrate-binding protein
MLRREQKLRLRVFLLISLLILVFILGLFIYPGLVKEKDHYFINFRQMSISGLEQGAEVKYQGVDIGSVDKIRVNPKDLSSILVFVEIEKGFPVKKDMRARLSYTGITGLKFIELSGGENKSENLEPHGEIPPEKGLGEKAEDIVYNIDTAVKGINEFLSRENLKKISLFLGNIEKSTKDISAVIEKKSKTLENSIEQFDNATGQISQLATNLNESLEKSELEKIAQNTLQAVENLNRRFSDQEFGQVIRETRDFIKSLNISLRKLDSIIVSQQESLKESLSRLGEIIDNLSIFSRSLVEDPTILIRKKDSKRRGK